MNIARSISLALLFSLLLCTACGGGAPARPLPPAPLMSGNAILLYRAVEGEPITRDETIVLYRDGRVSYEETVSGRKGSQSITPEAARSFVRALSDADFSRLKPVYRPRLPLPQPVYYTLSILPADVVRTVQWEAPQTPPGLGDFLREWEQFASVIRASAH